jgi:predicted DNA-binding protein (MmcQ/YjbR family)
MPSDPRRTRTALLTHVLAFPGAYEDHPWGESVAKVNKKIFVFLGAGEGTSDVGIAVKLDESLEQALALPGATPTGYGLGKAGWVSITLGPGQPPLAVLKDWVEESYRRVAPKRLVNELDAARS